MDSGQPGALYLALGGAFWLLGVSQMLRGSVLHKGDRTEVLRVRDVPGVGGFISTSVYSKVFTIA